jgi:putative flippase GtrA
MIVVKYLIERGLGPVAGPNGAWNRREFVRFVGAGVLNAALSFAIFCLGIILGLNYAAANCAAWLTGVVVGFYLNSRFVFRKLCGYTRLLVFFCINVTTLVTSITLLAFLIEVFGLNAIVASLIVTPIMVVISYLNTKLVVFR